MKVRRVDPLDLAIELSRHECREREALRRMAATAPFLPEPDRFEHSDRLRAWFREWRDHLRRSFDEQG
jgi:hypothetical protein